MGATVRVELPFPVSVNALYKRARGRVILSDRYRMWKAEAGWNLKVQKPSPIHGPVNVHIALVAPDERKRDADNLQKCVLDALVAAGVIEGDDRTIVRYLHAEWVDEGRPCVVTVTAASKQVAA